MTSNALLWFRRDLRDNDHAALHAALQAHRRVHCVFVFDTDILQRYSAGSARRVTFLWDSVAQLAGALRARGGGLHVLHGRAIELIPQMARRLQVDTVVVNRDYEPLAIERDRSVAEQLKRDAIAWQTHKDQVIFEHDEVLTRAGGGFAMFTPYQNAWLKQLESARLAPYRVGALAARLARAKPTAMPRLTALGFARAEPPVPAGMDGAMLAMRRFVPRLADYHRWRDFPALTATSRLSPHLRFGTVSIRRLVRAALARPNPGARKWLSELIWREFYFAVLAARPDVVDHAYRRGLDALSWQDDESALLAWCEGRTGYPIVDAAMRELKTTGAMHNRLRLISASFFVKHLGLDWRRGERYFGEALLDYDLAANNGNWQWCASTGADAQPWFRVFNPVVQSQRFDPDGLYIRRWIPELTGVPLARLHAPWQMSLAEQDAAGCIIGRDYPMPIVDHAQARQRALDRFDALRRRR